jgi:hypothetical protein
MKTLLGEAYGREKQWSGDADSIPETGLKKWGEQMLYWPFFAFSATKAPENAEKS